MATETSVRSELTAPFDRAGVGPLARVREHVGSEVRKLLK